MLIKDETEKLFDEFFNDEEDINKYSNANLLDAVNGLIIYDENYFSDLKYFIKKECQMTPINKEIEEARKMEFENGYSKFSLALYCFKENFFKMIGKNPIFSKLEDYKEEAILYLENTYPYCFFLNGSIITKDMDSALLFYAKMQGATNEQLEQIIPMLKSIPIISNFKKEYGYEIETKENYCITCDMVVGTTIPYYQADNLYDTLVKLNDKNISRFINYLAINDVFHNPTKVMKKDICCHCDYNDNLFVEEGNHRIMVYKAMLAIKRFIKQEYILDYGLGSINLTTSKKRIRN